MMYERRQSCHVDPTQVTLRLATSADEAFICRLIEVTMRSYVEQTWGSFSAELTRHAVQEAVGAGSYSVVAYRGEDVGALAVERAPSHLQLAQIFIAPAHQNRGIGTHLIREVAREARSASKPLRVRVLLVNPARKLYEREGFRVTEQSAEGVFMEKHC